MNAREEIFNLLRKTLCNETTDCENYPECVNSGDLDGCPPLDLAQAILGKLPSLGFIRLEDVEIDKEKLAIGLYRHHCGEEYYKKHPWEKLLFFPLQKSWLDTATAISQAKGIIKRKEGKECGKE